MDPLACPPGTSFAPVDGDLITLYLRPKIAGEPLPSATAAYIHDRDVYAAEPAALVSGLLHASVARNGRERSEEWYFYTAVQAKSSRDSRRCRAVAGGAGTWHSEKARQEIVSQEDDRVIGYRHSFTFVPKNGWLMLEYTLVGQEGGRGEAMPVLCKIYRSPHAATGQSSSGSKKRKAAVERSDAGSSGRARGRRQFPLPPAPSTFLIPIEAQTEKKAEDEVSFPTEAQGEKNNFLVPVEYHAVQEAKELQGCETQQQPLAPIGSSRASSISRLPMAFRCAFAGALASIGHPFEEWATEVEINSHYGDYLPAMGGFISPYDTTRELKVSGFPPSDLTSYTLSPSAQYWDTLSHGVDASTLLSAHQGTHGMSCYGATALRSNGAGSWATPPSASELLPGSWTGGHLYVS